MNVVNFIKLLEKGDEYSIKLVLEGLKEYQRKNKENSEIFSRTVRKWGNFLQVIMVFEKFSELQKELTKWLRCNDNYTNLVEELADVHIVLEQLLFVLLIPQADVDKVKEEKIKKLAKMLNAEESE